MEKLKEILKKWVNILSGVYIIYIIGRELHVHAEEINVEFLRHNMTSVIVGLIFLGSSIILIIGHYKKDKEARKEMIELFSKAKIFWDFFYQKKQGEFLTLWMRERILIRSF